MVWNFCTRHTHHTTELLSSTRLNSFIKSGFGRKENIILSANVPFFVSFTRCKTGRCTYLFYKREYDIILSWLPMLYAPCVQCIFYSCRIRVICIIYKRYTSYNYVSADRATRCWCITCVYINIFIFDYLNSICTGAPVLPRSQSTNHQCSLQFLFL